VTAGPAGGLVDLLAPPDRARELIARSLDWPSWCLTRRQLCDLELLTGGGFSPLTTFLGQRDYDTVCSSMRLSDGLLWPIPVTLDVPDRVLGTLGADGQLALRDDEGVLLASLRVTEVFRPDRVAEADAVYGTTDLCHPGVEHLLRCTHPNYVSGVIESVRMPAHRDFRDLRQTPSQLRAEFARRGWHRVVAFQTRNPMHRAHHHLTLEAARRVDANLLIHPVVGVGKPGDVPAALRVRCYRALLPSYPDGSVLLSVLPLAMRMAGPREALWHAIIRRNYGATHFIVGRDHAGPGSDHAGKPFYEPYEAQNLLSAHAEEVGIQMLSFPRMVYLPDHDRYAAEDDVPAGTRSLSLSGTELRERLATGRELPEWFTPGEVAAELRRSFPPRTGRGLTIFFTGLSGSGKSTIAESLRDSLAERGRTASLLDGDLVRQHLSRGLGFSRADRDENIRRIGFVAAEVTRHSGVAICAPIAPYETTRREVRRMVEAHGGFVLVYLATSLSVCEARDRKGLYAKARRGLTPGFTGVSDPFEVPRDADLIIDTADQPVSQSVQQILDLLQRDGYLPADRMKQAAG